MRHLIDRFSIFGIFRGNFKALSMDKVEVRL